MPIADSRLARTPVTTISLTGSSAGVVAGVSAGVWENAGDAAAQTIASEKCEKVSGRMWILPDVIHRF